LYLSFTGGPTLERLRRRYGARCARALYCSVDPELYYPEEPYREQPLEPAQMVDLGYLGTYSSDRQPVLDRLMLDAARRWPGGRFVVAGPQYPEGIVWPANVTRVCHVEPADHRAFYTSSRFTLNVTRRDMVTAGYSPSVRLFEAAACRTPIISDAWDGLDTLFTPGRDILISRHACDTLEFIRDLPEADRRALGERARSRVLAAHTSAHRAVEFERAVQEARGDARPHPGARSTGSTSREAKP